jgi:yecA family protein
MRIFAQNDPLMDAEFDRLGEFLKGCAGGKAMNVEELDGFFAALVASPEVVMPSGYLPEVFGGEMPDAHEFGRANRSDASTQNVLLGVGWR